MTSINPDLELERSKASFPVREMTYLLYGGKEKTEKREKIQRLMENEEVFRSKADALFLDRSSKFERALNITNRIYSLKEEKNLTDEEFELLCVLHYEDLPMNLQAFVISSSLKSLCSDEQMKEWVPKVERYEMIVSYAQTELGHGSNVSALQTEAVYIKDKDEFDIHSPTLESTKWWIGQLGKCANYCIVFAQLIIDGKSYGPHPFMVQIRSLEDHKPLKGITVGDIGPKFGFNAADNGFIRFNHVRIPRKNMISRFFNVSDEGKYIPPPNPKLVYGSMLAVRVKMTSGSSSPLRLATTIAVRYSAIRRQFASKKGEKELQIIDYRSQQYRILPVLATAYAAHFTGEWMTNLYERLQRDILDGDFSLLSTIHASSAGLKSLLTTIVSNGIETCRFACGGHGYSLYSGLPNVYSTYVHIDRKSVV